VGMKAMPPPPPPPHALSASALAPITIDTVNRLHDMAAAPPFSPFMRKVGFAGVR